MYNIIIIGKFTDKIFFVNGTNIHEVTSNMYSASSLVLQLFSILTFIGILSCRRGCVWGIKFRFGVLVCLSLMFLETYFRVKIRDAPVVICSQSVQVKLPDMQKC